MLDDSRRLASILIQLQSTKNVLSWRILKVFTLFLNLEIEVSQVETSVFWDSSVGSPHRSG